MEEDPWLAERLGCAAWWVPPHTPAGELREHAAAHAPAFYQAKVDARDVAAVRELSAAGMTVVDLNLTLSRAPDPSLAPPAGVGEAAPADAADLLEIATRHYDVSRFHMDPEIPAEAAARIKRDWVRAYLDGERGNRLLVAERDGRAAGFLAELADGERRVIDLIAVRADARGAGLGRALVTEVVRSSPGRVDVGTQAANVGALRFYESLGFRAAHARYVLHLHARAA